MARLRLIFVSFGLALACLTSGLPLGQAAHHSPTKPQLRAELLRRVKQDQEIRNELIRKGADHPDPGVLSRMKLIDRGNTERMGRLLRTYGWPGRRLVGRDGSEAAFLMVQHADLPLQKRALPLVRRAYRHGDLSGQDYALLLDRVLVTQGKPQVYGTQAKRIEEWNGHEPALAPIADEANVDRRRAKVGLVPLAKYREVLRQLYFPEEPPK